MGYPKPSLAGKGARLHGGTSGKIAGIRIRRGRCRHPQPRRVVFVDPVRRLRVGDVEDTGVNSGAPWRLPLRRASIKKENDVGNI